MNRPLETFLVERYWPGVDLATLRDALPRLEAIAHDMTAAGSRVEHVGSILMPVDEVVFSLIAAGDEALVRQLNERAHLPADRIAAAVAFLAGVTRPDPDRGLPDPDGDERSHEPTED